MYYNHATMPPCAVANIQFEIARVIFCYFHAMCFVIVVLHRSADEIKAPPFAHNTLGTCLTFQKKNKYKVI